MNSDVEMGDVFSKLGNAVIETLFFNEFSYNLIILIYF